MNLQITHYQTQMKQWPQSGKHIMAQYTEDSVTVYQAYRREIGQFAASHQYFGGEFSYSRMSWIKPNFLWMMYRNGWGVKQGQEITLAIKLHRSYFEQILLNAVISSFRPETHSSHQSWKQAIQNSDVRLQWDPDHDPFGGKQERRAIQLGLRNDFLLPFKGDGVIEIEDISDFVSEQRIHVESARIEPTHIERLQTPAERVYVPQNKKIYNILELDHI